MNIIALTQARTNSKRFPKKILKKILGKTLLEIHLERLLRSRLINKIIVLTTTNKKDNIICDISNKLNLKFFRGSENDLLDRFYMSVKNLRPTFIVRLTSDCPLIDPILIDEVLEKAIQKDIDYYSNTLLERFPDGQDIEVLKFSALKKAWIESKLASDREHVTSFIKKNSSFYKKKMFKSENHMSKYNYNKVRLTVDELNDFKVIEKLILKLGLDKTWQDYANYYIKEKSINKLNNSIIRNEGYFKSLKEDK